MNRYCYNGHRSIEAYGARHAAEVFAGRKARREFKKSGVVRTLNAGSYSQDGLLTEWSAFIGYKSHPNETTGRTVHFTVRCVRWNDEGK